MSTPEQQDINVRVQNRMNFYGPVLIFIGAPISGAAVFFLIVASITHWSVIVSLSLWLVIGFFVILGLVAIALVSVIFSFAYSRYAIARGQRMRNTVLHTDEHYAIIEVNGRPQLVQVQIEKYNYNIRQIEAPEEVPLIEAPKLPDFVRYEDIRERIPRGHTLLGIGEGGKLETRPFAVLDTMWICGGSKVGKTNTMVIKVEEGHQVGRKLIVCDPHKTKSDSLYHAIRGYERDFLLPVAYTREEIKAAILAFKQEALRRIAGGAYREGWTLIVDEVGALTGAPGMRDEEQVEMYRLLAPVAKMCGEQLRGYGMSGWFISQSPIGLSWLNAAMTIMVHKLLKENQQKLATNNNREIMDGMANWPRGRVFVYGLDIQGEYLLQQPKFESETIVDARPPDMEPLLPNASVYTPGFFPASSTLDDVIARSRFQSQDLRKRSGNGAETALEASTEELEETGNAGIEMSLLSTEKENGQVGNETRETIKRMVKRGMPHREIAALVGLSGRKYSIYQQTCRELGIED